MIIQHNMQAMNTNRQLGISQNSLAKSTEKLSSGYRINRAGDDAAGLAISEKMRSQIRGLDRASDNSQDGISLIQTAEGALNESQSILQRMRELAVQAANDTNTVSDRDEIQKEINQLTSEINRIANTTEFNTMKLLRGGSVATSKSAGDGNGYTVIDFSNQIMSLTDTTAAGSSSVGSSKLVIEEVRASEAGGTPSTATINAGIAEFTGEIGISSGLVSSGSGKVGKARERKTSIMSDLGLKFILKSGITSGSGTSIKIVNVGSGGKEGIVNKSGNIIIGLKSSSLTKIDSQAGFIELISKMGSGRPKMSGATSGLSGTIMKGSGLVGTNGIMDIVTIVGSGNAPTVSIDEMKSIFESATSGIKGMKAGTSGSGFSDNVAEVSGIYHLSITKASTEAGDKINILGVTFTTGYGSGFNVINLNGVTGVSGFAKALANAINKSSLKDKLKASGNASGLHLYEKSGNGGYIKKNGVALTGTAALSGNVKVDVTASGNGSKDSLKITNPGGENGIKYQILGKNDVAGLNNGLAGVLGKTGLQVAMNSGSGTVYIKLGDKAEENTAEKIQEAIRKLGTKTATLTDADGKTEQIKVDFSQVTTQAVGTWDSTMTGKASYINATTDGNTDGGVRGTLGEYKFVVDGNNLLANGDVLNIGDYSFTVVDKKAKSAGASAYSIDGGNIDITGKTDSATQTAAVFKALKANTDFMKAYDVKMSGSTITIKETVATGNSAAQNISVTSAGGTTPTPPQSGGGSTGSGGGSTGSGGGSTPSAGGTFKVKLQVGANTGQSMTVTIDDNRALALGISKNAANGTTAVTADGRSYTAKFAATANVTDGTTDSNIEYALDIKSHDNATAAITVIDDALAKISAQRSQLGAYQNRLEHTIANLDNTSENLQAAESRIRDVNMAEEMTKYSKTNILLQAAQSMLAQANQSTQGVLTLLR